jgi:hypothetical protein
MWQYSLICPPEITTRNIFTIIFGPHINRFVLNYKNHKKHNKLKLRGKIMCPRHASIYLDFCCFFPFFFFSDSENWKTQGGFFCLKSRLLIFFFWSQSHLGLLSVIPHFSYQPARHEPQKIFLAFHRPILRS